MYCSFSYQVACAAVKRVVVVSVVVVCCCCCCFRCCCLLWLLLPLLFLLLCSLLLSLLLLLFSLLLLFVVVVVVVDVAVVVFVVVFAVVVVVVSVVVVCCCRCRCWCCRCCFRCCVRCCCRCLLFVVVVVVFVVVLLMLSLLFSLLCSLLLSLFVVCLFIPLPFSKSSKFCFMYFPPTPTSRRAQRFVVRWLRFSTLKPDVFCCSTSPPRDKTCPPCERERDSLPRHQTLGWPVRKDRSSLLHTYALNPQTHPSGGSYPIYAANSAEFASKQGYDIDFSALVFFS